MNYGTFHFEVQGLGGWDVLWALILPSRWWRRILAVRILRFRGRAHGSLWRLLNPPVLQSLKENEYTFCYAGQAWEIVTNDGMTTPFVPRHTLELVSPR